MYICCYNDDLNKQLFTSLTYNELHMKTLILTHANHIIRSKFCGLIKKNDYEKKGVYTIYDTSPFYYKKVYEIIINSYEQVLEIRY
jgi:hypothetical protein